MSKRTKFLLGIGVIAALVVGFQVVAYAVSLPGSNFEIDNNANLINDPPAVNPLTDDWATVPQDTTPPISADGAEVRKTDLPTGKDDDSLGEGTKEDDDPPTVVAGRIPNNKSDLLNFGIYLETTATGQQFLNMFWRRVQEPTGTTNMDFEFNQSEDLSANGVTPERTEGDLLIQYDLAQGGVNPQLFLSRWLTDNGTNTAADCEAANSLPCWSAKDDLTAQGDATGSINTTPITLANSDGLGAMSARTFGEAQVDFDALTGGGDAGCVSFGSAYLKSRSSDSFTAAVKDFIAPANIGLNNCATVIIRKETVPDGATDTFRFDHNLNTDPALVDDPGDPPVVTPDIDESSQFDLQDGDNFTNNDVLQNTTTPADYVVSEDLVNIPAGWDLTDIDCAVAGHLSVGVTPVIDEDAGTVTFDINSNDDVLDCTFTNEQAVTTIDTEQSVFPNDKATISGTGGSGTPTGTVKFELFGPDTPGSSTDDGCTGTADYTQDLVPLTNGVANTTNGDGVTAPADFAINASNEGLYWWKVTYTPDAASNFPAAESCVENTDVAIEDEPPAPTP